MKKPFNFERAVAIRTEWEKMDPDNNFSPEEARRRAEAHVVARVVKPIVEFFAQESRR